MFISLFNKFLSAVLIPIIMCGCSPVALVIHLVNRPFDLISLEENGFVDELKITAHRGVTAVAPENTLPAYEEAVRLGYYSAECDIRLTKDGKWVLSHNEDLNRRFWQVGNVSETEFDDIRTYSYKNGSNFWKYKDLKIPTLDEFLDVFVGSETRPQIEIKTNTYDSLYTVIDAVEKKGLAEQSIIISFDLKQLEEIHKLNPNIELWYLVDKITEENIAEARAIGDNVWLSPNFKSNDSESIKLALDAGIGLSLWTVDTVEDARALYDMGVRYIETDRLCK